MTGGMTTPTPSVHSVRPERGLPLGDLARELPGALSLVGAPTTAIFGVRHDSRFVEQGDLFVARRGGATDGKKHIAEAKRRGAVAVLLEQGSATPSEIQEWAIPCLMSDDVVGSLAFAAAAVYGHPGRHLDVVGITGTNGKTTTAHLLRTALDGARGEPSTGVIGTVGHTFRDIYMPAKHTTPEADEVARLLALFRVLGARSAVMEVSSIAIATGRVRAIPFRVAAFTNLTQDHLDFHTSMEAYGEAKAELFSSKYAERAVLNIDDAFGRRLAGRTTIPVVRVSARTDAASGAADLFPIRCSFSAAGIDALLRTPVGDLPLQSCLIGRHNLENLMVAIGIAHVLGADLVRVTAALANDKGAPGRLERCDSENDDVTVLVDYAHTPDALGRVLDSIREVAQGNLVCVFGCGGDRDAQKRPLMGEAAAMRSDRVLVTNDNPRSEDAAVIASAIEPGIIGQGFARVSSPAHWGASKRTYAVELDRAAAIDVAIATAHPGDVVLIAGKGHEDYQIIGDHTNTFDDRVEARRALARRRGS